MLQSNLQSRFGITKKFWKPTFHSLEMTYSYLLQTALKATNVFKQEHKVDRSTRGQTLGSGFRGCTIWFTGKCVKNWP